MKQLDRINRPGDVNHLQENQLPRLCAEIRQFLIRSIARTGGHLASNLGAVELTLALHRVFDVTRDRLVFDVGHQCYVHKLLTGRREQFSRLRQLDGISGFPKPEECPTDAFIAGHASTSISVALGMARARTRLGADYHVISVIGDGSMTGGLAYEGLSNAGAAGEPMIVILNDNGMSIAENVGGLARHLTGLRLRPGYGRLKRRYRAVTDKLPGGQGLYRVTRKGKKLLKNLLLKCSFFEDLGFYYIGPVDGHDLKTLTYAFSWAKSLDCPVLVHVNTTKGRGYAYSEQAPGQYHGVGSFSPQEGVTKAESVSFSDVFGETVLELGKELPQLCTITAAMQDGTGLTAFAEHLPDRYFDVGIAEGHAICMAAGMAKQKLLPVVAMYSTFLQRAYDMLIHDVALPNLHVVLAVDRAGLVGADGETHQGVFDASFLSQIPNMTVYCPASFAELRDMLRRAVFHERGPVAVRYPRGGEGRYRESASDASSVMLQTGDALTLVTYGTMINSALEVAGNLAKRGIAVELIKLNTIKPLDLVPIQESVERTGRVLVAEDQLASGAIGQQVLSALTGQGVSLKAAALMNLGDAFIPQGSPEELMVRAGIDSDSIERRILAMLAEQE